MNVCPECKTKIYNPSASFCYKCGHRIENSSTRDSSKGLKDEKVSSPATKLSDNKEAEKHDATQSVSGGVKSHTIGIEETSIVDGSGDSITSVSKKSPDNLTKRWDMFVLGANALSIMFLIVAVGLFFRSNTQITGKNYIPTVTINNVEINDEVEDIFESQVLKNDLYTVAPKDATFYSESSNLSEFISNYLTEDEINYIESTYELTMEEFLVFIRPNYAYFVMDGDASAVILQTGGFDFFERTYSKYQDNKSEDANIFTRRVGEFLVISRDPSLINNMDDVNAGLSLSINSDPSFSNSVSSVTGRVFAYIFARNDDFVEDGLSNQLEIMGLDSLYDEIIKAGTSSVYVVKEGSEYFVKPIN